MSLKIPRDNELATDLEIASEIFGKLQEIQSLADKLFRVNDPTDDQRKIHVPNCKAKLVSLTNSALDHAIDAMQEAMTRTARLNVYARVNRQTVSQKQKNRVL